MLILLLSIIFIHVKGAHIFNGTLYHITLSDANIYNSIIIGSTISHSNIIECTIIDSIMTNDVINNSIIYDADCINTQTHNVVLYNTICTKKNIKSRPYGPAMIFFGVVFSIIFCIGCIATCYNIYEYYTRWNYTSLV